MLAHAPAGVAPALNPETSRMIAADTVSLPGAAAPSGASPSRESAAPCRPAASGLLGLTGSPTFGEQSRVGKDVVQQVTGTVPGQAVVDLLYVGDENQDFTVEYGLVEESWEVRTVRITGPFYPPDDATYLVTLDQYGEPVTVTAP